MSEDKEAFRCKVCGGMLIADPESFGFSRCANCGNRFRISGSDLRRLKEINQAPKDNIFVSMTKEDVEREAKLRKTNKDIT